ncbi:MAG: DUF434 domain-containing protein [Candidatus Methanofastidiosia archaeon]
MSLHDAREELRYLLNKGYKKKVALDFVGNHYELTKTQRNLLTRTTYSDDESESTTKKNVRAEDVTGKSLAVDTYNVLITLESVVYGHPLVCDDGVVRDDKGVFGKYILGDNTNKALSMLEEFFVKTRPLFVKFFIDKHVSHSGELACLIRNHSWPVEMEIRLCDSPDHEIKESGMVAATADSAIIKYVDAFLDIPKYFLFLWK